MQHIAIDDYSAGFGRVRPTIKDSKGVALIDFLPTLKPRYAIVYRDIAIGYCGILLTLATSMICDHIGVSLWIVTPVTAALAGFLIAYLLLFIHEGSHWNLAADRAASDKWCNFLISWWGGMEIARYRIVHFQHHRALGTTADSEISYFFPLNLVYVAKSLTGIRTLEVLIMRRSLEKKAEQKKAASQAKPVAAIHGVMIFGALFHLGLVSLLAWNGYWATALGWLLGVGLVFPFLGALRQMLEHRSENASATIDYRITDHGAVTRLFSGPLSKTMGGAGFDRHLLHHWEPTISYTRLGDLENFLMDTSLAPIIAARKTSYLKTFTQLLANSGSRKTAA